MSPCPCHPLSPCLRKPWRQKSPPLPRAPEIGPVPFIVEPFFFLGPNGPRPGSLFQQEVIARLSLRLWIHSSTDDQETKGERTVEQTRQFKLTKGRRKAGTRKQRKRRKKGQMDKSNMKWIDFRIWFKIQNHLFHFRIQLCFLYKGT